MALLFIAGRSALADASELIDCFGETAEMQAARRAETSRDAGNVRMFCHWRHIERIIEALITQEVTGTVH